MACNVMMCSGGGGGGGGGGRGHGLMSHNKVQVTNLIVANPQVDFLSNHFSEGIICT